MYTAQVALPCMLQSHTQQTTVMVISRAPNTPHGTPQWRSSPCTNTVAGPDTNLRSLSLALYLLITEMPERKDLLAVALKRYKQACYSVNLIFIAQVWLEVEVVPHCKSTYGLALCDRL